MARPKSANPGKAVTVYITGLQLQHLRRYHDKPSSALRLIVDLGIKANRVGPEFIEKVWPNEADKFPVYCSRSKCQRLGRCTCIKAVE